MSERERPRAEREARAFGAALASVVVAAALWRLDGWARAAAMGAGALLGLASWRRPALLVPVSRVAGRLARRIGRVTTPVALVLLYLAVLVPVGLLLRAFRVDPIGRRRAPPGASYWRSRSPTRSAAADFERMS
ncbi:MAG: hypothetical protein IT376_22295 [Polyangiaceae bacterium]|nr:hypothetical protein [Polyangiaceae bacterium]